MIITGKYPKLRMRRSRKTDWMRRLVRENNLSPDDLIWPIFIREGKNIIEPIKTMPGVNRYSLDKIEKLIERSQISRFDEIKKYASDINSDFIQVKEAIQIGSDNFKKWGYHYL